MSTNNSIVLELEWRDKHALAFVCLLSVAIKFFLIMQTEIINPDGIRYVNSAQYLFQGEFSAAFQQEKMLGFTFLLGLIHLIIPNWFLAGKVLSATSLVLATIPLYFLTRELFGSRSALAACLAFCVSPYINELSKEIIKDPPFLLFILLAVWFALLGFRERRWDWTFLSGALAFLSMMFRVEGVVLIMAMVLFSIVSILRCRESRKTEVSLLSAVCFLPVIAMMTLTAAYFSGSISPDGLVKVFGRFEHYFSLELAHSYKSIYQSLKAMEPGIMGGQWTNDFFEIARHNLYLVYLIGLVQVFSKSLFPVFLVPLWLGLRSGVKLSRPVLLLICIIIAYLLMAYFFMLTRNFLSSRYILIPVVLSFPFIGSGLEVLLERLQSVRFSRAASALAVLLFIILPVGKSLSNDLHEKLELKEAGVWLKTNRDLAESKMALTDDRVAFYAGLMQGEYSLLPNRRKLDYEKYAIRSSSSLIVLETSPEELSNPPEFERYLLIKQFVGRKKAVLIYERKT